MTEEELKKQKRAENSRRWYHKNRERMLAKNAERSEYKKRWYAENRDRILAERVSTDSPEKREKARLRAAEWRKSNPERRQAQVDAYADTNAQNLREWRKKNADRIKATNAEWRERNKDTISERRLEYRQNNREKMAEYRKANSERDRARRRLWEDQNRHLVRARTAKRRASRILATPAWADHEKIKAIYAEAMRMTKETGEPYEVDHIVPLQSDLVCGLHVHNNLRALHRTENIRKSNLHWPDMP